MEFEIGKEYAYHGKKAKLVFIDEEIEGTKFLVVHKRDTIGYVASWAGEEELTELPPYHDFKRGEPVVAVSPQGNLYRMYFSHVDEDGKPRCFGDGDTTWSSEGIASMWDSVRKLTEEEKAEARKDHEALLQYFSS